MKIILGFIIVVASILISICLLVLLLNFIAFGKGCKRLRERLRKITVAIVEFLRGL